MSDDGRGEGASDDERSEPESGGERPEGASDDERRERATGDAQPVAGEPTEENDGQRFDRLPATEAEQTVAGRPTRRAVLDWWFERFGIDPATFDEHTFWEKGAGKIWALAGDAEDPIDVEGLGMTVLRTRQEHWKPTTNAVQRFGQRATRNVIELEPAEARAFVAGEDQAIDRWDGDWGYLIASHELAGDPAVLGVGLYVHGEFRSRVPKGRQREL